MSDIEIERTSSEGRHSWRAIVRLPGSIDWERVPNIHKSCPQITGFGCDPDEALDDAYRRIGLAIIKHMTQPEPSGGEGRQ